MGNKSFFVTIEETFFPIHKKSLSNLLQIEDFCMFDQETKAFPKRWVD